MPGIDVVGEADGGYAGIRMALQLRPDIVVMDVDMPDLDGVEATKWILARAPGIKVLAFSAGSNPDIVREMFSAGASGYLVKGGDSDQLVEAIHSIMAGRPYLSGKILLGHHKASDHDETSGRGGLRDARARKPVRCVLVDDSFVVRERIVDLLSSLEGIELAGQAADLATGTLLVRECQPDVLILDVDLVGQSGLDLLETAKVLNPAILVIMLTNHDHPLVKQRCADLGADFFFHKSTEFEKVLEVCREFIETRAAGIGSSPVPGSGYFNSGAPGAKEAP